ncbi:TPA: hypothetical protein ACLAOU_002142, partial [Neisseria meningitidis]
ILGCCFWFSVLVFCPCGNDGSRENAVRKVFGRHFLRFSGGGGFLLIHYTFLCGLRIENRYIGKYYGKT